MQARRVALDSGSGANAPSRNDEGKWLFDNRIGKDARVPARQREDRELPSFNQRLAHRALDLLDRKWLGDHVVYQRV